MNRNLLTLALIIAIASLTFSCARQGDNEARQREIDNSVAPFIYAEDTRTVTPELLDGLRDSDPELRAYAARSIGRIGVDDLPVDSIVTLLRPILHDSIEDVAASAAFAFGLLPDDTALANMLVEYAFTASEPAAIAAIVSAGRVGDSSAQLSQKLAILLHHKQPAYRSAAAMALFLSGADNMSYSIIQVALNDTVKSVRDTALYALVRLKEPKAREVYLEYTEDPDPYLIGLALRGLAEVGDISLAGVAGEFLQHPDPNLRSQAIATLSRLKCKEAEEALASVFDHESDDRLLAQALRALADMDARKYRKIATNQIYEDMSYGHNAAIVYTLAKAATKGVEPLLDSLVRDNTRLVGEMFDGLNRELRKRAAQRITQKYLPLAEGPSLYSAYNFIDEIGIQQKQWLTEQTLIEYVTADNDPVSKGANIENAATRRETWFFGFAQNLADKALNNDLELPAEQRDDIFRSLISATETMLKDKPGYRPSGQIKSDAQRLMQTLARLDNFVVAREARDKLSELFGETTSAPLPKPVSRYDVETLADELSEARADAALAAFESDYGTFTMELDYDNAPLTCLNFVRLSRAGFYSPVTFHRVIPNFVTQGGDPRGDGWGGPGYSIRCEYSARPYVRGTAGIATSGKDTGGSQFFFTLTPMPHLDARYTVFGQVVEGLDIVDSIKQGDKVDSITIIARTDSESE